MADVWGVVATAVVGVAGVGGTAFAAVQARRSGTDVARFDAIRELGNEKRRCYAQFLSTLEVASQLSDDVGRLEAELRQVMSGFGVLIGGELTADSIAKLESGEIHSDQRERTRLWEAMAVIQERLPDMRSRLNKLREEQWRLAQEISILGGPQLGTLALRLAALSQDAEVSGPYATVHAELVSLMHKDVTLPHRF